MNLLRGGTMILATVGVLAACAPKGPPPSQAIVEARQRAATADSRPKCVSAGPVLEVAFVFGAADLSDDARLRLDQAVAWSACTPNAQIVLVIDPEYHHRQPDKDRALMASRQAALRTYLAQKLAAGVLVAEGGAADPARPLLTIRARGW